jgi:hypothetical protein
MLAMKQLSAVLGLHGPLAGDAVLHLKTESTLPKRKTKPWPRPSPNTRNPTAGAA